MHRLLRRQLRKHLGVEDEVPAALQPFVAAVDAAYADFDSDRAMLERSLELTVKELLDARDKATQAQTRLTDAIESISEGFSLYDADDKLVIHNQRYLDMHGAASIDVVKQGVSFETILRNAVAGGEIRDAEGRADAWVTERLARHRDPKGTHVQRRADGRWIQINERKTDDGGTVATYTDITDVKLAEQAIQESEQRLRVIAEAAPMAVVIVTFDDGIIRYVNQRFCEMFGIDATSALGLKATTLYADPLHREQFIKELTEHDQVEGMEIIYKRASG